MRKVFSVALKSLAGFFFYGVMLLAFIHGLPLTGKLFVLAIFLVPAVLLLAVGMAVSGWHRWRRDVGIVLLSVSAFTVFTAFSMLCIAMSDEVMQMMPPDSQQMFSSYAMGASVLLAFAALGGWLLRRQHQLAA